MKTLSDLRLPQQQWQVLKFSKKHENGYWWDRAQESLDAARREFDAGSYAFAMNRACCALFYATSALLLNVRFACFL